MRRKLQMIMMAHAGLVNQSVLHILREQLGLTMPEVPVLRTLRDIALCRGYVEFADDLGSVIGE